MANPGLTGLSAWWALEETSSTRYDSHTTGNNLSVIVANPGSGVGIKGNCAVYTPAQGLTIADNASLSMGDIDFSISIWAYITGNGGIIAKGDYSAASTSEYNLLYSVDTLYWAVSNGTTRTVLSKTLSTGAWHHIVAWHDSVGNVIGVICDGGTATTKAHSAGCQDGSGALYVGLSLGFGFIAGKIDEVAIYKNRVLTSSEASWLYNSGAGRSYSEILVTSTPAILHDAQRAAFA
jgi:hypothetical protein